MRALVKTKGGAIGVAQVEKPSLRAGQVLVKVEAASFSRSDWAGKAALHPAGSTELAAGGRFGVMGSDLAGVVAAVGAGVQGFFVGDRVCAVPLGLAGSAAEYAVAKAAWCAHVPAGMDMVAAAALPSSALTALAALEKLGSVAGKRVLVCGASGGVGQYAVLLASGMGAEVTAACGAHGLRDAAAFGAGRAYDYAQGLGRLPEGEFDAVIAVNGKFGASEYTRVLRPKGSLVLVGMDSLRPSMLAVPLQGRRLRVGLMLSLINKQGLQRAVDLVASCAGRPTIEELVGLDAAVRRLGTVHESHPAGKIVVRVQG